jgi:arylsulfatase A-like enzyme
MKALRLIALAVPLAACAPPMRPPPLQRLLPSLGVPAFVSLDEETRPALRLRPGDALSCEVTAARGSRLVFALGVLEDAPREGSVRLTVTEGGRPVFTGEMPARRERWWKRSATLESAGRARVGFRVEHVGADGKSRPAPHGAAPWIALGSPRLYSPREATARRAFVWISQDTVRADHLGAYRYPRATSPAFDRFAEQAVLFDGAHAPASWTLPSLASQILSRYPSYHGAVLRGLGADPRHATLFELLADAGFTVLGVTGNVFVAPERNLADGFDALRYSDLKADALTRYAGGLLDEWQGGDVALFIHYMDPHFSYDPPAPFDTAFDAGYHGPIDGKSFRQAQSPADVEHVKALYDGELAFTDRQIGALFEELRKRGLYEPAVVAYTADHGEEFKDHGAWGHADTLYEELLHVPFALRAPGISPRRVADKVCLVDLAPTVLDLLGIPPPASFQGRSLAPLLRGGALSEQPTYAETSHTHDRNQKIAVREGRLKYVMNVPRGREAEPRILREELFDLEKDPGERASLEAREDRDRLRRYALAYLARGRAESSEPVAVSLSPVVLERLRALGYVQ